MRGRLMGRFGNNTPARSFETGNFIRWAHFHTITPVCSWYMNIKLPKSINNRDWRSFFEAAGRKSIRSCSCTQAECYHRVIVPVSMSFSSRRTPSLLWWAWPWVLGQLRIPMWLNWRATLKTMSEAPLDAPLDAPRTSRLPSGIRLQRRYIVFAI